MVTAGYYLSAHMGRIVFLFSPPSLPPSLPLPSSLFFFFSLSLSLKIYAHYSTLCC